MTCLCKDAGRKSPASQESLPGCICEGCAGMQAGEKFWSQESFPITLKFRQSPSPSVIRNGMVGQAERSNVLKACIVSSATGPQEHTHYDRRCCTGLGVLHNASEQAHKLLALAVVIYKLDGVRNLLSTSLYISHLNSISRDQENQHTGNGSI